MFWRNIVKIIFFEEDYGLKKWRIFTAIQVAYRNCFNNIGNGGFTNALHQYLQAK